MAVFPVGNLSSSGLIQTANKVQARKQALSVLEKSLHFPEVCKADAFERQNGRIVEFYTPVNFSDASLTPATEGDVPTALSYNNRTLRYSMGQYSDYVMFSTAQMDFSPTPDLADAGNRLGYRGAKRIDDITRQGMDIEYPSVAVTPLSTYCTMRDLRLIRTRFKNSGMKGQSKFSGMFPTIMSPVVSYDLVNDPTSGGYTDVMKYQNADNTPVTKYPVMDDHLMNVNNCYVIESNNVKTSTSGGNTLYWTYFFADEAFAASTLNAKAPPLKQPSPQPARFNVHMEQTQGKPDRSDPTGEIGGFASYNIYYAAGCLHGSAYLGDSARFSIMQHQSTVA